MEISGWGLQGQTSTTVSVDGVDCTVDNIRSTNEKIYCVTGVASAASVAGEQPGQPGITYSFVNPTDTNATPSWTDSLDGTTHPTTVSLWTSMDTPWNGKD